SRSHYQIKAGLWLYDQLARGRGFQKHSTLNAAELSQHSLPLTLDDLKTCYQFWDATTDDLELCLRVAASASQCGVSLCEGVKLEKITPTDSGYHLELLHVAHDQRFTINTMAVVLATGPWSHNVLKESNITVKIEALNNKGCHILFDDLGFNKGVFLETMVPRDGRIFFVLPWQGYTLLGTTETIYDADPDQQQPESSELDYLLNNFAYYSTLSRHQLEQKIRYVYSGLRWLVKDGGSRLSKTSRESYLSTYQHGPGSLWILYGGKLTSYRLFAQKLGEQISKKLKITQPSQTHDPTFWSKDHYQFHIPSFQERFRLWP
ncbi:MAG: FAD-dependent oxidoreductase, partial [Proteobacteria bacterium]|nr:FAD-dependent oxidoreductase [Pseudomonadota bacterium]